MGNTIEFKRNLDEKAVQAASNDAILEEFLSEERGFVRACAGKALGRHIAKDSEEELLAMEAFVEAVRSYAWDKGRFLRFAELVIKRRLIDEARREARQTRAVPMDPADLADAQDRRIDADGDSDSQLRGAITEEIRILSETLKRYGFSFFDLADASPKADKTRVSCRAAVRCVVLDEPIYNEMRDSGLLPIKKIAEKTGVPRKILERHRKYIIAASEILNGMYPCLSDYIGYIRRSDSK